MMTAVTGRASCSQPPPVLWAALNDPERLGEALPDVGLVEVADDGSFTAGVRPRTNLGVTPVRLEVQVVDRDEPRHVRLTGMGTSAEFRVGFDVAIDLAPEGEGTAVTWTAGVQAYGVIASLTQRVMPGILRDQVAMVLREADRRAASAATQAPA